MSRRRLLGTGLGVVGAAAAASALPPNLRRVLADPIQPRSLDEIEHVVVLMQENRSFDHYFGTLPGVRGFDDPNAIELPNGKSVFYQPDEKNPAGYLLPFRLDTTKTSSQAIPSTSHAYTVQHDAVNNGKMDRWLPVHRKADGDDDGPYTMGYYTREDIPFQFALAESFTLCDSYFSSVLGPTWPNRLYHWTGSIDPRGENGGPIISNVVESPYTWKTYPERLTEAGVSWHVYREEDDYGCNPLVLFKAFQDADPSSPLHQHGLAISPPDKFEEDARADRLPAVSWIIPTAAQCEHPDYTPASGADFVARKLDAVAANPEVWAKTVFILNYDENDGLFDHVVPPMPPEGTTDEFVDGLPIGGGIRVPCIIISPWTQGGMVATENFDHTSVLRFLEQFTGVAESNISDWRRQTFGDLTSALGRPNGTPFPDLPPTKRRLWKSERDIATLPPQEIPGKDQTPPHQETERAGGDSGTTSTPGEPIVLGGSREQTKSRVVETRTSHSADFPRGVAATGFPGIPVTASAARTSKAASPHAYVATITGYQIAVIDAERHELIHTVDAKTNPYGVAATPDGTRIFVTNSGASDVSVLDAGSDELIGSITVGLYPHGIVISPEGDTAYVANTGPDTGKGGSRLVSVLDTKAEKVTSEITVGLAPHAVQLSPDGDRLYVTCSDELTVVDTSTLEVTKRLPTITRSGGLFVSPDGAHVYVADCWHDSIVVISTKDNEIRDRIQVGSTPWDVTFRPDGARAYVSNANDDTVSVIDTGNMRVTDTIGVGHIPTGINATEGAVWVSNNASSTVTAISTDEHTVAGTIDLGLSVQPAGITVV